MNLSAIVLGVTVNLHPSCGDVCGESPLVILVVIKYWFVIGDVGDGESFHGAICLGETASSNYHPGQLTLKGAPPILGQGPRNLIYCESDNTCNTSRG